MTAYERKIFEQIMSDTPHPMYYLPLVWTGSLVSQVVLYLVDHPHHYLSLLKTTPTFHKLTYGSSHAETSQVEIFSTA